MHEIPFLTFAIVSFLAIASPGPDVMLTLANGVRWGLKGAIVGLAATATAHALAIWSISFGMDALLAASPLCLVSIRWIGVAYLATIGFLLLRSCSAQMEAAAGPTARRALHAGVAARCALVALTNPKAWLFFLAFMPQFVSTDGPQALQYAMLATAYAAIEIVVLSSYAALAANTNALFNGAGTVWLNRACGGALLALASTLLMQQFQTSAWPVI